MVISGAILLPAGSAGAAGPTQLYLESFQSKSVTSPIRKPNVSGLTTNTSNFACLTASADQLQSPVKGCGLTADDSTGQGVIDSDGSGTLRLTNNTANRVGGAFYSSSVATTASSGLDLAFSVYQYRSTTSFPADGISFSLAAVDPTQQQAPTSLGPAGGNLGYNGQGTASPNGNGLAHGYLGIGFDTFGNYSNDAFNNATCTADPSWATPAGGSHRFPQAVTVRGPGHLQSGYCMLNSSLNTGNVADPGGNATANNGLPVSRFTDGVTDGSTTLTSASAGFTAADVGAPVFGTDAQGAITDETTIVTVNSATSVTLSQAAVAAVGVHFYISRTRIYSPSTTRGTGTAVEIAINPTAAPTTTAGGNGLAAKTVPAMSYLVSYKPVHPVGAAQQTLVGVLPTTANNLLPAGAIPAAWINPATGIPYQLSFGWTGSTGSNNQINEVAQTAATSLGGAPPVLTLTAHDTGVGNFNGNFSGDGPDNRTTGTIYYDGGVDSDGEAETESVSLLMRTSPGLQITGPAVGTGWTCPVTNVAADFFDGVTPGGATLTSATAAFTARDVGKAVVALDGQGAFATGTTIVAVNSATSVTLNQAAAVATSSIAFGVGALSQYTDGASTASSTTFTSATGSFTAADVGALLVETGIDGAIPDKTTITAFTDAQTVTLSNPAAVTAAGVDFEVLRKSPAAPWSATCTHAAPGAPGTTLATLGLPVVIADAAKIVAPVADGFIFSLDGNSAYAADPGIGTNPYRRVPTPVFTGPFPQGGPNTGLVGHQNSNSGLVPATLRGGNLDAVTSVTWGNQALTGPCPATPVAACFTIGSGTNAGTGTLSVSYAAESLAGSTTPSIAITNANGSTAAGRPFRYYPPPTLVTTSGSAGQNKTAGSEPAIITAPPATNLSNTTTVWWGDGTLFALSDCGALVPRWNCFVVNSATQITAYPPGEVDVDAGTDYRVGLAGPPAQPAHTANVSLDTTIDGAAVSFEDFGNYTYFGPPHHLGWCDQWVSGTDFDPGEGLTPLSVCVLDEFEQRVTNSTLPITVAVNTTPNPGTVLEGTVTVNAVAGVAVFDGLANVTELGFGYDLIATAPGPLTTGAGALFDIVGPGAAPPPEPPTPERGWQVRIGGKDRSETAQFTARVAFPDGADVVYIATSRDYADALSAGPGAVDDEAPILLTEVHSLNPHTASELRRLQPRRIVVMGGWAAVDDAVFLELHDYASDVVRIAGVDRFGTAAMLSADKFPDGGDVVYIATGRSYPDALAGGLAAAIDGNAPILLVEPDALPDVTAAELERLGPTLIHIVGGTGAVSTAVEVRLAAYAGRVDRVAGADRYETTAAVNRSVVSGTDTVFVVTGKTFGDALTGIPIAALTGSGVLMIGDGTLHTAVSDELQRLDPRVLVVLGGTAAVARHAEDQLTAFIGAGTGAGRRGMIVTQADVDAAIEGA